MKKLQSILNNYEKFEQRLTQTVFPKLKFGLFCFSFFYLGFYTRQKFEENRKKEKIDQAMHFLETQINKGIVNEVFKNKSLTQDLINQIEKFLSKEQTEILFCKLMEDLLKLKNLLKKSDELVRKKVLLEIVLTDKQNEEKLKQILIKISKNPELKQLIKKALYDFFETPDGYKIAYEGMSDGLNSNKTITEFKNSIQDFLFEELEDENSKIILQKKISDLLNNNQQQTCIILPQII